MTLSQIVKEQIETEVTKHQVLLFMKGDRRQPQCGFSASVVGMLDSLLDDYATINVLENGEIREGIKSYSDWPTIPQLYIGGEFVGGADITRELFGTGQLHTLLGIDPASLTPAEIMVSDAAKAELLLAANESPNDVLQLAINAGFQYSFGFGPARPGDIISESNGLEIHVDPTSIRRANGMQLDFVDDENGRGFKIENPNAPAKVQTIGVIDLKTLLDGAAEIHLFDVRGEDERAIAKIEGAQAFGPQSEDAIMGLDKDTPLYFHCHHGGRSQAAAEHFVGHGFTKVYNVVGGIDAWSQEVDSSITRY